MKRLIIVFLVLIFLISVNAQTVSHNASQIKAGQFGANFGGGDYSFPQKLGVGISNPEYTLDVAGPVKLKNTVTLLNPNGNSYGNITKLGNNYLELLNFDGNINFKIADKSSFEIGYTDIFSFSNLHMYDNTIYGSEVSFGNLTLDSTFNSNKGNVLINPEGGKVGIGTKNPNATFHVVGDLAVFQDKYIVLGEYKPNDYSYTLNLRYNKSIQSGIIDAMTSNLDIRTGWLNRLKLYGGTGGIEFWTGNNDGTLKGVWTSSGNLGIGTSSPDSTLHVIGGVCIESSDSGCAQTAGSLKASTIYQGSNRVIDTISSSSPISVSGTDNSRTIGLNYDSYFILSGSSLSLANSGVTAGTYGSSTQIPQITVDSKGRITSASNIPLSLSETDPQVGAVTNTYVCYGDGSAVQCGDAGITYDTASDRLTVGALTVDTNTLYIDSANDRVGIGTTNPAATLEVNGNIKFTSYGTGTYQLDWDGIYWQRNTGSNTLYTNGNIQTAGTLSVGGSGGVYTNYVCSSGSGSGTYGSCGSSRKYKNSIKYLKEEDYERILREIQQTNVATFKMNQEETGIVHIGLIAEESPSQLQFIDKNGNVNIDFLSVQTGYTWAGIKALANHIDEINQKLINYENQILELKNTSEKQQREIDKLKSENDALKVLLCLDHPNASICNK